MTRMSILLICGSLNQTQMMYQLGRQLSDEFDCYYTPYYGERVIGAMARLGWLNFSILGGSHRRLTEDFLAREGLRVDFAGKQRKYDLVVTGTDSLMQQNIRNSRVVLIQEGMILPEGLMHLPRWLANNACTGLSDLYDVFCVASKGYRDLFIQKGVRSEKIAVTGIPNFDNAATYLDNNFPHHNYVLVATSSLRETFGFDNRAEFIQRTLKIAAGRTIIYKLHPNENVKRATAEIHRYAPDALVCTEGNTNHMIANCDVLITQFSSVVYIGIALGKEVYSDFDISMLKCLAPIQNGGTSALNISGICRRLLELPVSIRSRPAGQLSGHKNWRSWEA
jgi:hypothetical protein